MSIKQFPFDIRPDSQRESFVESQSTQYKDRSVSAELLYNESVQEVETDSATTIDVNKKCSIIRYQSFASGDSIQQPLPPLSNTRGCKRVYIHNISTDANDIVNLNPDGTDKIDGASTKEVGKGESYLLIANPETTNWDVITILTSNNAGTGIELDDGTTNIGSVKKITYDKAIISGNSDNATVTPTIQVGEVGGEYTLVKAKEIEFLPPLEVNNSGNNVAQIVIKQNPYLSAYMSSNMTFNSGLEEKTILFNTVDSSYGAHIFTAGHIEIYNPGLYYAVMTLQVKESGDPTFLVWPEILPKGVGSTWQLSHDSSMIINKMKTDTNFTYTISGMIRINEDDTVRFKGMSLKAAPDKIELKEVTQAVSLGTITQRSARINLFRVADLPE